MLFLHSWLESPTLRRRRYFSLWPLCECICARASLYLEGQLLPLFYSPRARVSSCLSNLSPSSPWQEGIPNSILSPALTPLFSPAGSSSTQHQSVSLVSVPPSCAPVSETPKTPLRGMGKCGEGSSPPFFFSLGRTIWVLSCPGNAPILGACV